MYVPLGSDGLDVYAINTDGTLIYVKNIDSQDLYKQSKSIFIIDVEIKFDKIFVLDSHSGVVVLDQRSLKLVEDFGQIIEYGCKMIKEFNEQTLFLLCQRNIITYVNEYGLHKNDWFFLRRHYLNGQYFDIDVTHDFAILRGVDAHRVIYHSIWHGFLQEDDETLHEENTHYSLEEEYLYLPHL